MNSMQKKQQQQLRRSTGKKRRRDEATFAQIQLGVKTLLYFVSVESASDRKAAAAAVRNSSSSSSSSNCNNDGVDAKRMNMNHQQGDSDDDEDNNPDDEDDDCNSDAEDALLTRNPILDLEFAQFYSSAKRAFKAGDRLLKQRRRSSGSSEQHVLMRVRVREYRVVTATGASLFDVPVQWFVAQIAKSSSGLSVADVKTAYAKRPERIVMPSADALISAAQAQAVHGWQLGSQKHGVFLIEPADVLELVDDDKHRGVSQQLICDMFASMGLNKQQQQQSNKSASLQPKRLFSSQQQQQQQQQQMHQMQLSESKM
jgi:hypothetical protein